MRGRYAGMALAALVLVGSVPKPGEGAGRGRIRYRATSLGNTRPQAYGINDNGEVVGANQPTRGRDDESGRAFLWSNGTLTNLGPDADAALGSAAYNLNNAGLVVGERNDVAGVWRAGQWEPLPELRPGAVPLKSVALAVNAAGWVVGNAEVNRSVPHAFLFREGEMLDLTPSEDPFDQGEAAAVNGQGQVPLAVDGRCLLWDAGTAVDVGAFVPRDITDTGRIVGAVVDLSGARAKQKAVVWEAGQLTPIGPRGKRSEALATNEAGQVVGSSGGRAALWEGGRLLDLNRLTRLPRGWTLEAATGINERGQIIANARRRTTPFEGAFLLSPR